MGLLLYIIMVLDYKYIEKTYNEISPKYPLLITLMIWILCEFVIINKQPYNNVDFIKTSQTELFKSNFFNK